MFQMRKTPQWSPCNSGSRHSKWINFICSDDTYLNFNSIKVRFTVRLNKLFITFTLGNHIFSYFCLKIFKQFNFLCLITSCYVQNILKLNILKPCSHPCWENDLETSNFSNGAPSRRHPFSPIGPFGLCDPFCIAFIKEREEENT